MIRTKYKIVKKSPVELATEDASAKVSAFADDAKTKAAGFVASAQEAVASAQEQAGPRLEAAREEASHRVEAAKDAAAPKVESARQTISDEVLPRVLQAISGVAAAGAAAKATASANAEDRTAELQGQAAKFADQFEDASKDYRKKAKKVSKKAAKKADARKHQLLVKAGVEQEKKGGKGLIFLGLVAAAAAVALTVYKRTAPKDDPWATPLADPYVGTTGTTGAAYVETPVEAAEGGTTPVVMEPVDNTYAASTPTTSDKDGYDEVGDGQGALLEDETDPSRDHRTITPDTKNDPIN
ncbi:hypothetical protein MM440_06285 [Arsenicicoccus piscis]|uniref:Uncharacterized protein n=1 Tax=Arsenicicoccus piscis TaxID=673954 RepID=A0ABQ6HTF6_9MICO|nr:hypothetical protein [Arsenicicoccus piscis]MCH8627399.1 hypothetical protein [Arsenicicoccus piscis]GMA21560.1 hypothetical protein GCM10025862_35810 [Arsenicicoccus piscis]